MTVRRDSRKRKCNNFRFTRRDGRHAFSPLHLIAEKYFFQLISVGNDRNELGGTCTGKTTRRAESRCFFPSRKTAAGFPSTSPAETHCIRTLSIIQAVFLISKRRGRGRILTASADAYIPNFTPLVACSCGTRRLLRFVSGNRGDFAIALGDQNRYRFTLRKRKTHLLYNSNPTELI